MKYCPYCAGELVVPKNSARGIHECNNCTARIYIQTTRMPFRVFGSKKMSFPLTWLIDRIIESIDEAWIKEIKDLDLTKLKLLISTLIKEWMEENKICVRNGN